MVGGRPLAAIAALSCLAQRVLLPSVPSRLAIAAPTPRDVPVTMATLLPFLYMALLLVDRAAIALGGKFTQIASAMLRRRGTWRQVRPPGAWQGS